VTVADLVARLRERLRDRVEAAALEAELLAAAALCRERRELLARGNEEAGGEAACRALKLLERRLRGEPLALVLGFREFFGRRFEVRPGVLVPRPETELLVEVALAEKPRGIWADVGAGSGAVAVTLVLERRGALRAVALDVSPFAAACARRNARALGAQEQVFVAVGDLLAPVAARALDGVVSNPPYVEPREWALLPPEVQRFEPKHALTPAPESAAELRARLLSQASTRLATGGFLALEVGAGQAGVARDQLLAAGFRGVRVCNDLAGIGRVVSGRLSG
jgi:release factor glutamine methyltransferase